MCAVTHPTAVMLLAARSCSPDSTMPLTPCMSTSPLLDTKAGASGADRLAARLPAGRRMDTACKQ